MRRAHRYSAWLQISWIVDRAAGRELQTLRANKGDAAIFPAAINKTQVQDALNRRISARNPDGGTATTGYDANNNVVSTINELGNQTTFAYDVLNRRTTTTDARGGVGKAKGDAAILHLD